MSRLRVQPPMARAQSQFHRPDATHHVSASVDSTPGQRSSRGAFTLDRGGDAVAAARVLPEDEPPARLEQAMELPRHGLGLRHGAEDLDAQHGIQRALGDAAPRERLAVLDAAGDELVLVLQAGLRDGGAHVRGEVAVRLDAVDEGHGGGVVAAQLVARGGAKLEDEAARGGDEPGDAAPGLELDEVLAWRRSALESTPGRRGGPAWCTCAAEPACYGGVPHAGEVGDGAEAVCPDTLPEPGEEGWYGYQPGIQV